MGILGDFLIAGAWLAPIGLVAFFGGVVLRVARRRSSWVARLMRAWGAAACLEGLLLIWFFFSHIDHASEAELTTYLILLVLIPVAVLVRTILLVRHPHRTLANAFRAATRRPVAE